MSRKLVITYDRRAGLFGFSEDPLHGGLAEYRAVYHSAIAAVEDFLGYLSGGTATAQFILNPLHDGRLVSITLEAP